MGTGLFTLAEATCKEGGPNTKAKKAKNQKKKKTCGDFFSQNDTTRADHI